MSNIYDYVKWRGDIQIQNGKISFADSIALCELSYLDMSPVMEKEQSRTLREIVQQLDEEELLTARMAGDAAMLEEYRKFFREAAKSERFGTLIVTDYEETLDAARIQFCAVRFILGTDISFIAFRGTDDSLIGWREDFMASYRKTDAQKRAVEYLEEIMQDGQRYYIAGHSKGGNLAMISAASLSDKRLSQVEHVYINDGPGICKDVMDVHLLDRIQKITTQTHPEYCVIGKLFTPQFADSHIIASSVKGILQHSMMSWQFDYEEPRWSENYDPASVWLSDVMDGWMQSASVEERDQFVTKLFDSMETDGARTLTDITASGFSGFENIMIQLLQAGDTTRKVAAAFPRTALFGRESGFWSGLLRKIGQNQKALAAVLTQIAVGVIFRIVPHTGIEILIGIILAVPVLYELILTVYRLYRSHWDIQAERMRINICIIIAGAYSLVLFKEGALYLLGSALFGILFMMEAVRSAGSIKELKLTGRHRIPAMLEAFFFFLVGGYIMVAPEQDLYWYAFSTGSVLIVDGIYRLISLLYGQKSKKEKTGVN
ncbi:MAG: DUF2974 domain-containing protein [Butyrivibrio sp.]|nr:DUF2974 domain-containing protein [Butyrivibrio sp.]